MRIPVRRLVLPLLLVAAFAWWRIATADERRVKRAFRELSELAEKSGPGENPVLAALDAAGLAKLLAAKVELSAPELYLRSWTVSRDEIVRQAFAAKARASRLSLGFDGLDVRFPERGRAVATGKATISGDLPDFGGAFGETRKISVAFRRDPESGNWLAEKASAAPPDRAE